MNLRQRTWETVDVARAGDRLSYLFDASILLLIFLNVLAVILGTVASIQAQFGRLLWIFEVGSVAVFTVEYAARLWSCVEDPRYAHPLFGRLRFAVTPLAIVDLLAVLPFYIPQVAMDTRFLRVLRMFRILRLIKVGRYYTSLHVMVNVVRGKREELILALSLMLLLLILSASLMYYCENEAQPEAFPNIPATMWWAVATLTTVGYGDVYPITPIGKLLGSVIAILGIGMFALPAGLLGAGFVEEIQKRKQGPKMACPHCGRNIDEPQ